MRQNTVGMSALLQSSIEHHVAGRHKEAEKGYLGCLTSETDRPIALENLTVLALERGELEQAKQHAQARLAITPMTVNALHNMAIVQMKLGNLYEADSFFELTLEHHRENVAVFQNAAQVLFLRMQRGYPVAGRFLVRVKEGVERFPDDPILLHNLALIRYLQGNSQESRVLFEACARRTGGDALTLYRLFSGPGSEDEGIYKMLCRHIDKLDGRSPIEQVNLLFARHRAEEAREDAPAQARYLDQANAAMARIRPVVLHNEKLMTLKLQKIKEHLQEIEVDGLPGPRPIFIIGMPRNGSSLVEQVLAASGMVEPCGELPLLNEALGQLLMPLMQGVDPATLDYASMVQEARNYYLQGVQERGVTKGWFVDKMAENSRFAGLLPVLFPECKVVYVTRDAVEIGLSCYRQYFFEGHGWSCTPHGIADYIHYVESALEAWKSWFEKPWHTLSYEALVNQPEEQAQALFEYLELPWDVNCLDIKSGGRPIVSAAMDQVPMPIHKRGLHRSKQYPLFVKTLKDAMVAVKEKAEKFAS
uniref:Uncharacterized protein n=1 Tax=Magnetococcus massalia (strain MO-1) TaxID=451514 RepID=A0A1S7LH23_MAGMO|nr:Conserved protein of unknown function. Containing TRP domain and sulfotransferase domain [Candidatus Magnetococcus massalia]